MSGDRQWLRYAQVVIGKDGKGLSIDQLRINFEVTKTLDHTPNKATIKIYNLTPEHSTQAQKEYREVILNAGYQGATMIVFRGNIQHAYRYKDGLDWVLEIEAADGDRDHRLSVINETLAAGTTNHQAVDKVVGTFKHGTSKGHIGIPEKSRLRGRVLSGASRDVLHDIAADSGAHWSIQNGELIMVGARGVAPGEAVVVNSDTGLLSPPEIDDKGITVKCMMNPKIMPHGALQLDNSRMKQKKVNEDQPTTGKKKDPKKPVRQDPEGIYKVLKVKHTGDTLKGDWSSEALCIGLTEPIPKDGGLEDDGKSQIEGDYDE